MTPTKSIVCILLGTALALAVVRQSAILRQAGYRLEELRGDIAEEKAEYAVCEAHVCKLRSPKRILALAERLGLELERPAPSPAAPVEAAPEGPADQGPVDIRQEMMPPADWPRPAPEAQARVADASSF